MLQPVYQFGIFSVDTCAHALFKNGSWVPVQEQPFQVLLALLENPGQVVTREMLRERLWGTTTFVDFDQSLNSALRRLRLALEDNPREPMYVETVPRVGFRFLPEVSIEHAPPKALAPAQDSALGLSQTEIGLPSPVEVAFSRVNAVVMRSGARGPSERTPARPEGPPMQPSTGAGYSSL